MRSSVAVAVLALSLGASARRIRSYEPRGLYARGTGVCTGPASSLTGEECAKAAAASGFMVDGECLDLKMAGGSVHKHKTGQCHKHIGGASGSGSHSHSGTRSRPRSYDDFVQDVVARADELGMTLVTRGTGVCTGPSSSLTGEECAKAAAASGFMVDGQCLDLKMAGGSVHKHKNGQCHKHIGGSASGSGSGSGSHSGTHNRPRSYEDILTDIIARADEAREGLVARGTGVCTGPSSSLSGEECARTPAATGFMVDGECLDLKMAEGSVHKHKHGQCHKHIGGAASGSGSHSGTHSRPRRSLYDDLF